MPCNPSVLLAIGLFVNRLHFFSQKTRLPWFFAQQTIGQLVINRNFLRKLWKILWLHFYMNWKNFMKFVIPHLYLDYPPTFFYSLAIYIFFPNVHELFSIMDFFGSIIQQLFKNVKNISFIDLKTVQRVLNKILLIQTSKAMEKHCCTSFKCTSSWQPWSNMTIKLWHGMIMLIHTRHAMITVIHTRHGMMMVISCHDHHEKWHDHAMVTMVIIIR